LLEPPPIWKLSLGFMSGPGSSPSHLTTQIPSFRYSFFEDLWSLWSRTFFERRVYFSFFDLLPLVTLVVYLLFDLSPPFFTFLTFRISLPEEFSNGGGFWSQPLFPRSASGVLHSTAHRVAFFSYPPFPSFFFLPFLTPLWIPS